MNQFKADIDMLTTADSGPRDTATVRLGVFHTTENSDNTPPANIARWQLNRANDSSYNILFGTRGTTVRSNDDNYIPWSAGRTGNRYGFHGSAVGRASRKREDWLKWPAQMESMSRWAADLASRYGIPLRWLTPEQVRGGSWGFCGHDEISKAWGEVNHTDPGKGFPHDLILARAAEINRSPNEPEEPGMTVDRDSHDLILDQLAGHPWPEWPGWPQLGDRSLVDGLAAVGAKLGVPGMYDPRG